MFYLYILKSKRASRHYIGIAENIAERLVRHNGGEVKSTEAYRPWMLIYQENFSDKRGARKREIFLKNTAKARKELFERIHNGAIV